MRLALAAVSGLVFATAAAAEPSVAAGQRIAQRHCGACHATGDGASPLPAAPPFRTLSQRYRAGGLDELLTEGMLAPETADEEGSPRRHPRMPQVQLGPDEVANLKTFLESLQPAP